MVVYGIEGREERWGGGVTGRFGRGLEERVEAALLGLLEPNVEFFAGFSDPFAAESVFVAHELADGVDVGGFPDEVDGGGIGDVRVDEQLARGLVVEVGGHGDVGVEVVEHGFDVPVLLDEVERRLGADVLELFGVVAAEEDAEVDELLELELEAVEHALQAELEDRQLLRLAERQTAQQHGRAETQRVHVLARGRPHVARFRKLRAHRLRLARRLHVRHAHQLKQPLAVAHVLRLFCPSCPRTAMRNWYSDIDASMATLRPTYDFSSVCFWTYGA
ncbi:hypothetical protein AYI69_g1638 [Smittium culicis]|uniref:Uncharacterized protein n=1 Tax=Smittium culicis TaxID=133412 RepID=A0A1R1YPQ1_9FUNG|nr:hypothetical protein AYI69_g1638 [Smittium culicis]